MVRGEPPGRAAVRPRRHLRAQRDQGPVPRRGRRRGGPERAVPRRGARQVRRQARAARSTRTCASATTRDVDHDERRAPLQTHVSARRRGGSCRLEKGSFASAGVTLPGRRRRGGRRSPARTKASNVLLVDGDALRDRHADHRRRPADRLQLPRPDDGDGPLRARRIRARGATSAPFPGYMLIGRGEQLRVDAHLGRAPTSSTPTPRRLCGGSRDEVPLQGQVPPDGDGQRRHDQPRAARPCSVRFRRTVHGPVIGYARVAGSKRVVALSRKRSSAGRETTDQIFFQQLTYGRVRSARRLRPRGGRDAADVQLVLRRREGHRVLHDRAAAGAPEGRQRRPAGRRPRPVRVEGLPARRASTRRTSTRRAGCSSTGTTSRRRTSRPATTAGTRAARSASTGCSRSWRGPRSTRRRPCSAPRTRRDRRPARR